MWNGPCDPRLDTLVGERVVVPADDGRLLEGLIAYTWDSQPEFSVLIAGPHPLLGGDLENNVVRSLLREIALRGGLPLAFNYSGVGRSDSGTVQWEETISSFWKRGTCNAESQWVRDAGHALRALRQLHDGPLAVIGYSFGCWAVAKNLHDCEAQAAVLISPNPARHSFDHLIPAWLDVLVVHSDNDFACPAERVQAWCAQRKKHSRFELVRAGEHFFRGIEDKVATLAASFLCERLVTASGE